MFLEPIREKRLKFSNNSEIFDTIIVFVGRPDKLKRKFREIVTNMLIFIILI